MSWQVPITSTPHDECPHCGIIKPKHLFVCRACARETPFDLWRDLKTAEAIEHVHTTRNTQSPYRHLEACAAAVTAAKRAILSHLKQFSSALT